MNIAIAIFVLALIIVEFFAYFVFQMQADVKGERSLPGQLRTLPISLYTCMVMSLLKTTAPDRGLLYAGYLSLSKGVVFLLCFVTMHFIARMRQASGNMGIWNALHKTFGALGFVELGFGPVYLAVYAVAAATDGFAFAASGAVMMYLLVFIVAACVIFLPLVKFQLWLTKKEHRAVSQRNEPSLKEVKGQDNESA